MAERENTTIPRRQAMHVDDPSLQDVVTHLMMAMPVQARANIESSLVQARDHPDDYIRYINIKLADMHYQIEALTTALVAAEIIILEDNDDDTPSA